MYSTSTCVLEPTMYHVFPWKVLPGKGLQFHIIKPQVIDLQGRSGLKKKKKKNHEPASLAFLD